MKYSELCDILCSANAEHKRVEAFVTFAPESFPGKEYSKIERTYLFTSDNKAFVQAGGYSIFGDCMDGKDIGVRLERYMRDEKGGKDGWAIENCGIVKYQLVAIYERILKIVGYFDTEKDANRAMWLQMAGDVGCTEEELYKYIEENEPAGECSFGKMSAWANNAGPDNGDVDWNIVPIFMDGANVVTFDQEDDNG